MLKTAFIGNRSNFNLRICEWLSEHTELSLIIWTHQLSWTHRQGRSRTRRVVHRFIRRARLKGWSRAVDEFSYYVVYRSLFQRREARQIWRAVKATKCDPQTAVSEIRQLVPDDIKAPELVQEIQQLQIDAMFSMCIDVYLPAPLIHAPRHGSFLWHEGITPEYRGVYPAFWALANEDYDNLGCTLLRMNEKLDAGDIFVQSPVRDVHPSRDWHSYVGHKAILDSLPDVKSFLQDLDRGEHQPIPRPNAVDRFYSYPTLSALLKIMLRRNLRAIKRMRGRLSEA